MDDMRRWTDLRDQRVWKVSTYWGGQAMAVSMDADILKLPAHPAPRLIEFIPADGRGPIYRTGMGEDERESEELNNKELEELLDQALSQPSMSKLDDLKAAARAIGFEWRDSQDWSEGRLDGELIVAPTDKAPLTDSTRKGPFSVRPTHTFGVDGHEYVIGKDPAFGVAFALIYG